MCHLVCQERKKVAAKKMSKDVRGQNRWENLYRENANQLTHKEVIHIRKIMSQNIYYKHTNVFRRSVDPCIKIVMHIFYYGLEQGRRQGVCWGGGGVAKCLAEHCANEKVAQSARGGGGGLRHILLKDFCGKIIGKRYYYHHHRT